jgi:hypothetical protein
MRKRNPVEGEVMNPQTLTMNTHEIWARVLDARPDNLEAYDLETPADPIDVRADIAKSSTDTAQRVREESLEFLHKLVMG